LIFLEDTVSILVALVAGAACAAAILASRRSILIPALLIQFLCAALLFSSLPLALVIAYCVVGACVCGILAVTSGAPNVSGETRQAGVPSGLWFRVVAVLLVALASMSLARTAVGVSDAVASGVPIGAGLLMGLGLLQVGLSEEPLRVGSGLMSIIGGFEIGYTTVETAIALHGLIMGVPLLIALVVAYLEVQPLAGSDTVR
jgi:hypothetical protein